MAQASDGEDAARVAETLIEREEVVALLFNVADIALTARALAGYLTGEDDGEVEEEDE